VGLLWLGMVRRGMARLGIVTSVRATQDKEFYHRLLDTVGDGLIRQSPAWQVSFGLGKTTQDKDLQKELNTPTPHYPFFLVGKGMG